MKKVLSIVLALVMMLSCSVTLLMGVAAEGTDATAPASAQTLKAPVPEYTQSSAAENGTQNIRFLAGVSSLEGSSLGYDIVAEFTYNGSYSRIPYGGDNYETNKVFEYVYANGKKCYPADIYGDNTEYKYWFTMTIKDIPTDIGDIYFRIRTYVVDANGAKTYSEEIGVQYTDGKIDRTLTLNNFNNLSGSFGGSIANNGGALYGIADGGKIVLGGQDTGLMLDKQQKWGSYGIEKISFANGEASLGMDGDFIGLVDKAALSGMDEYSIDFDITIDKTGVITFMLNNGDSAPYTSGLRVRLSGSIGDGFTGDGSNVTKDSPDENRIVKVTTYETGTEKYKDTLSDKKVGEKLHLTIDVNNTTHIMSIYVDGALVRSYYFSSNYAKAGGFYVWLQGADITIDNLRAFGKKYESGVNGDLIFKQDFDGLSGKVEGLTVNAGTNITVGDLDTRLMLAVKNNWSANYADVIEFADGAARFKVNGDYIRLIDETTLAGLSQYSIHADVKIAEAGIISFFLNNGSTVINNDNKGTSSFLRIRVGAGVGTNNNTISGVASNNIFVGADDAGSKPLAFINYVDGSNGGVKKVADKKLNDAFHLTINVDNVSKIMAVYVDGVLVEKVSFTTAATGGFYANIQEADLTIDNLCVYDRADLSGAAGDVLYSQDFNSVSGSTTTETLLNTGINVLYANSWSGFTEKKYAVVSNGALKLNGGGTAYEILSGRELNGVNAFTLQFDLTTETLGVMEVLLSKNHTAYASESNCVMIRDGGNGNLKYWLQYHKTDSSKNDIANTAKIVNGGIGQTYKVVIEVVVGSSMKVSLYDTEGVEVATTTATTNLYDELSSVSIRLEGAPITVDNIIYSVGSYSDYCLQQKN